MTTTNSHAASSAAIRQYNTLNNTLNNKENTMTDQISAIKDSNAFHPTLSFTGPVIASASAIGGLFKEHMDKLALLTAAIEGESEDQFELLADALSQTKLCDRKEVLAIIREQMENNDGPVSHGKVTEIITEYMDEQNVVTHDEFEDLANDAIEENPEDYVDASDVDSLIMSALEDHDTELEDRISALEDNPEDYVSTTEVESLVESALEDHDIELHDRVEALEDASSEDGELAGTVADLKRQLAILLSERGSDQLAIEMLSSEIDVLKQVVKMMVNDSITKHGITALQLDAQSKLVNWNPDTTIDIPTEAIDLD